MLKPETLVEFEGVISFGTIEMLLNQLRSSDVFHEMKKPARKRLYSIFVESIDNIFKYAARMPGKGVSTGRVPRVSVIREEDRFMVKTGNLVLNDDIGDLKFKLDRVNQLDSESLKSLYEDVINKDSNISDTGAGLGLITIAMKTTNDIEYFFSPVDSDHSFFEIQITLNG